MNYDKNIIFKEYNIGMIGNSLKYLMNSTLNRNNISSENQFNILINDGYNSGSLNRNDDEFAAHKSDRTVIGEEVRSLKPSYKSERMLKHPRNPDETHFPKDYLRESNMNVNNYGVEYIYDYIIGMEKKKKVKYRRMKYKYEVAKDGNDEQIEVGANQSIPT
jgi:hypothetical protein